jgi:hypothetical protein
MDVDHLYSLSLFTLFTISFLVLFFLSVIVSLRRFSVVQTVIYQFVLPIYLFAGHSGRAVWGMNCLCPLERWDHGFESHSSYGCLSVFILCLYRLRACDGLIPHPRSPTHCLRFKKQKLKRFTDALCSKLGATGKRKREICLFLHFLLTFSAVPPLKIRITLL